MKKFTTIVNMARSHEVCFVVLMVYLFSPATESKVFSKSLAEISLIQQPTLKWSENNRDKREINPDLMNDNKDSFIHSQNTTLTTTTISLLGENDNEVFVAWAGVNNDVSNTFIFIFWFL